MKKAAAIAGLLVVMLGYQNCGAPPTSDNSVFPSQKMLDQTGFKVESLDENFNGVRIYSNDGKFQFAYVELLNLDGEWAAKIFDQNFSLDEKIVLASYLQTSLNEFFVKDSLCTVLVPPPPPEGMVCTQVLVEPYADLLAVNEEGFVVRQEALDQRSTPCSVGNDLCAGRGVAFKSFLLDSVLPELVKSLQQSQ